MDTSYRNKIKEIKKCLEVLDTTELNDEAIDLLGKSWAALMLAASNQKSVATEKNYSLVFVKSEIDKDGNATLELSKAKFDDGQQVTFNQFMTSCKDGDICDVANESACEDKYKEIRKILGYGD